MVKNIKKRELLDIFNHPKFEAVMRKSARDSNKLQAKLMKKSDKRIKPYNYIIDGSNAVCFPIDENKPIIIFPVGTLPNNFNFMSKKYLREHLGYLDTNPQSDKKII